MTVAATYTEEAVRRFHSQVPDMPIVLEFFIAFSRFEYALKKAGFLKKDNRKQEDKDRNENRDASADWDAFAACVKSAYRQDSSEDLQEAIEYLIKQSPKKQMVTPDNRLFWHPQHPQPSNDKSLQRVLECVRRVRNNLFHGGKAESFIKDPARDNKLIQSSLVVLNSCLEWSATPAMWGARPKDTNKVWQVHASFTDYLT